MALIFRGYRLPGSPAGAFLEAPAALDRESEERAMVGGTGALLRALVESPQPAVAWSLAEN